ELGKGTLFTVYLPQKQIGTNVCGLGLGEKLCSSRFRSMTKLNRVQTAHEYMPYGRVLIVDDVESNLYVAKGILLPYGLKIETVVSGFEGIDKIKGGNKYDIVFMDHMMPKMSGIEATKILRDMGYNQPIVALTANAVTGASTMFLNNGFDGYLSKPIDLRELNAILNRFIRDKHPLEVVAQARAKTNIPKSTVKAVSSALALAVVKDVENALAVLENMSFDNEDMGLFITTVHGTKSALANIGEAELSEAAFRLELAGKAGETDVITCELPGFIGRLKLLIQKHKPKKPGNAALSPETGTIFVVDDSNVNLVVVQEALAGQYRVAAFSSALLMFEELEKTSPSLPSLILLDIMMPEMDGFAALERLKSTPEYAGIPVIFLTGSNNEADKERGFEMGIVDYITKPFSEPLLLNCVETCMLSV
ncbi:MAG: response regulator, partial [Oscillospiraceae bacterium]|nr:response regulator [Oscillospiraceae bacterium]